LSKYLSKIYSVIWGDGVLFAVFWKGSVNDGKEAGLFMWLC